LYENNVKMIEVIFNDVSIGSTSSSTTSSSTSTSHDDDNQNL